MSSTKSSSRDFSFFSLFTAGLVCLLPFANAYTQPTGTGPVGNPIYEPGLNSVVPVGQGFTVVSQRRGKGRWRIPLLTPWA